MIGDDKKEFGDYQTPIFFTDSICKYLNEKLDEEPQIIIEPTCGIGNFLVSCSKFFPNSKLVGIELNNNLLKQIPQNLQNLKLYNEDIFNFNFNNIKNDNIKDYFIIGNPPWVTNTKLSKLNSTNLPMKSNFKNKRGIESITGESNFDISESIILKMVEEFKNTNSTLIFICKTIVARNVFKELIRTKINFKNIKTINFDSKKIFDVSTSACILFIKLSSKKEFKSNCGVFDIKSPNKLLYKFGYKNKKFYSNISNSHKIDGDCPFEWRQGVKHDCSKIMELKKIDNNYQNKNKDVFKIEDTLVYPLIKSSDLKHPVITHTDKFVIITQKKVNQDTKPLKEITPETWNYLNQNKSFFDKRKSVIYLNSPDFSIFGIGDYAFSKYKVGISGFYKNPLFSLLCFKKPIMLDDTCYFISFEEYDDAYITMLILNSDIVQDFLMDIAFLDGKRPFTKKILKRIDLVKCLNLISIDDLKNVENKFNLSNIINEEKFKTYKDKLESNNIQTVLL